MQWERRGIIFSPAAHQLVDGCTAYAKSPQAIDMGDKVRVYFSSQRRTVDGKWISCPQYVDFTLGFTSVIGTAKTPLMSPAALGQYDEHGIFPFHAMQHEGRILAYTSGWSRRKSVPVDMAIGLCESFDGGETFMRHGGGGPVMAATLQEPYMIADGFVRFYEGSFHMWYIYGTAWKHYEGSTEPERIYKIAHATSHDGCSWTRDARAIIPDVMEGECQALPSVIYHEGCYHMVFCYRHVQGFRTEKEHAYRLGYAKSNDLVYWVRQDDVLNLTRPDEGWDSQMMCYPHIFSHNGQVYLLYNGNEFGKSGFGLAILNENYFNGL